MAERLEEILTKGYGVWKSNPVLAAPPILNAVAVILLAVLAAIAALVGFIILQAASPSLITPSGYNTTAIVFVVLLVLAAIALFIPAVIVIGAFFTSGAIGMSMTALETGKAKIEDMMEYGWKKFMQVAYASLLILLLHLAGLLFLIPGAAVLLTGIINVGASLLILGLVAMVIYGFVLSLLLSITPYVIVAGDLGAMEGLAESYRTVMRNKLSTVLLFFTVSGVGMLLGLVLGVFTSFVEIMPILGALVSLMISFCYAVFSLAVLTPIFTMWWTAYSMDRITPGRSRPFQRAPRPRNREQPSKRPDVYM